MKLKCTYCHKRFKYESERKRHEESHSPHYQCKVCSKKFSFLSAVRRHEKQHNRKSDVYCDCGKKFRDEILLKRHINYAHKGTFTCEKCNASFNSKTALHTHMKTHKPESERQFKCTYDGCGKSFNFHHHLKHHVLTHTNAKQHYCNVCKKGFIQLHHLKAHLNTHNPDTWLHCTEPYCKKKFTSEYARKRHLLTHKIKSEDENSDPMDAYSNRSPTSKFISDTALHNQAEELELQKAIVKESETITGPNFQSDLVEATSMDFEDQLSEPIVKNVVDCKTVIGGCLVKAESDKSCLCAQMSDISEPQYDLTPIDVKKDKIIKNNVTKCNPSPTNCANCECASTCSISNKNKQSFLNFFDAYENEKPNIEITINGAIKIKETFDSDFDNYLESPQVRRHSEVEFPYNSCKAVLGNCIVSGNGTMGEGCLCMKMKIEEQVTAEEIEDIVPHPNDPKLRNAVINIL